MDSKAVTIKAIQDGPYIVKELKKFSNRKGAIKCNDTIGLCRCGQSARKPYCDGTHKNINFNSENQLDPAKDQLDTYAGKKITIRDNRSICAHAGYCTDGLPSVFRHGEDPFIDPDGAVVAKIIDIINQCPSGALSYIIEDDTVTRLIDDASIFVAPNGPYVVRGKAVLLETVGGKGGSESTCTLCRCGASKNKPYCDGSHWSVNFNDDDN